MEKINLEQLSTVVELASTVLHMLYVCVVLFVGAILYISKMAHKIEKSDDKGTRAHIRIDETNERVSIIEERVYDLK